MKPTRLFSLALVSGALAALAAPTRAQEPLPLPQLPDSVARRFVDLYNSAFTTRLSGEGSIAAGSVIEGNVGMLGGRLVVAGRVDGSVIVINGDLIFEPGASVGGDVLVAGGGITGDSLAAIAGSIRHHPQVLRYREGADGSLELAPPAREAISAGRDFSFGRADVLLAVRNGYNRAEGLPIQLGPRFRFGNTNPTYLDGFIIFRTATGLDQLAVDRLGYAVRLEQAIGGVTGLRLGARVFSEILPIERSGISDRENSLATFLLHRDHRDSWDADGWAAYLRWTPPGAALDIALEYADEHHRSVAIGDPWSILRSDDPWRPNPVVAEGDLNTFRLRLSRDTRNEEADPAAGWLVRATLERALGGSLRAPVDVADETGPGTFQIQDADDFTAGELDIRRYARTAPYARVAFRFLATGALDGGPLPPQRQHALGGAGSLPAYDAFQFDCGARDRRVQLRSRDFFPHYGCDRAVLVQVEYQAGFPFLPRLGRSLGLSLDLGQQVRWVAFLDAGRAWTRAGATAGRTRGLSDLAADAGLGIRIGQLGFYWAVPFGDHGSGVNFFVRLGRRF